MRKAATIALGICLCTSACAGTDANAPDSPSAVPVPQQEAALAKLVPISVAQDGALTVATDPTYPPLEFLSDTGEVQGAEIDLVVAISTVLGLEPEFEQEAFTAIPGAVRSGRYELGVAALALRPDTPRLNNAVINLRSGSQLVRSKSAANVTLDSLCGVGVAALEGSLQIEDLVKRSKECRAGGQPSIDIQPFADQGSSTDAVLQGEADAFLSDSPISQDTLQRYPDRLEAASKVYNILPLAMLTAAEYTQLTRAVRKALQHLIDTGYYQQTMRKWNVTKGLVTRAKIKWADYVKRGKRKG